MRLKFFSLALLFFPVLLASAAFSGSVIFSTNSSGALPEKNNFATTLGDDVYMSSAVLSAACKDASGSFAPWTNKPLYAYVVSHKAAGWNQADTITSQTVLVPKTQITTNAQARIPNTRIFTMPASWASPATDFDIVVDFDGNGIYDANYPSQPNVNIGGTGYRCKSLTDGDAFGPGFSVSETTTAAILTLGNATPANHSWHAASPRYNEMLQFTLAVNPVEPILFKQAQLTRTGTGNTSEIKHAFIIADTDNNGRIGSGDDFLGNATFATGTNITFINTGNVILDAGSRNSFIIAYEMTNATIGSTFSFTLSNITAYGAASQNPVFVSWPDGLLQSATKTIVLPPNCTGTLQLVLTPSAVILNQPPAAQQINATILGFSDCEGKNATVSTANQTVCSVLLSKTGAANCTFSSPASVGTYSYQAAADLNNNQETNDTGETATAQLTVIQTSAQCGYGQQECGLCGTRTLCENQGCNWCGDQGCTAQACTTTCSSADCSACTTRTKCEPAGCYWYDSGTSDSSGPACHETPQPSCTGTVSFKLGKTTATPTETVTANISGLSPGCDGKTARISNASCAGTPVVSCHIENGACTTQISLNKTGSYPLKACIDKNNDGTFSTAETASATLTIKTTITTGKPPAGTDDSYLYIAAGAALIAAALFLWKKKKAAPPEQPREPWAAFEVKQGPSETSGAGLFKPD